MKAGTESTIKFRKLKRRLGLPEWQVVGLLESIWRLTATSAPDGSIGRFSNEDIAASIEYDEDADELISHLVECGWLDPSDEFRLVVHDWHEHAPMYIKGNLKKHGKSFASDSAKHGAKQPAKQGAKELAKQPAKHGASEGATKSSQVKSSQVKSIEEIVDFQSPSADADPPEENPRFELVVSGDPPDEMPAEEILSGCNAVSGKDQRWTSKRRRLLKARWRDPGWRASWRQALEIARGSPFLTGENDRGWSFNLDFFLRPDSVQKICEGAYDGQPRGNTRTQQRQQANGDAFATVAARIAAEARENEGFSTALPHQANARIH